MSREVIVIAGLVSLLSAAEAAVITPASLDQINSLWRPALAPAHAAHDALTLAQQWVVVAPGRVEPRSGLIRLGTSLGGRVEIVPVKVDDRVEKGEMLLQLGDKVARARWQPQ
jgi:multidrug efflux pump subunit AcrA (membrane-fusion protein)